jgi:hypothetical protein
MAIVVVGGGLSGCAAAAAAARAGVEVILLEKTDMLGGLGLLSGLSGGDGGTVALEEAKVMGAGDIWEACQSVVTHEIDFIEKLGRRGIIVFSVLRLEGALRKVLGSLGVKVRVRSRVKDVIMKGGAISHVVLDDNSTIEGKGFVDATGSIGTVAECTKHGFGCVMCVMRCPTFGGRVSISAKAGVKDFMCRRKDGTPGAFSSAFMLEMNSLSPQIVSKLDKNGYIIVPLPPELIRRDKLATITATENAQPVFIENLVIFNNGFAKVMVQSFMPLDELHRVPGFENARMADPISGGVGNAVRFLSMAPRDNTMKVEGVANLYCAGEKSGPVSGVPVAITTGILAGHTAARNCLGKEAIQLPRSTAMGEFIAFAKEHAATEEGLKSRCSFGGIFFERLKNIGLSCTSGQEIRKRIEKEGLTGIFSSKDK